MKKTSLIGLLAFGLLAGSANAQSYTETFENGVNAGGWTVGNGNELLEATGGNPDGYLHNFNIDTFAPQPRTQGASIFTGDYRSRNVTSIGFDLRTISTNFAFAREATLMLYSDDCAVYFLGTELVPQANEGWRSIDYGFDPQSATIPAGWLPIGSCADGDAAWNTVMTNVTEVRIFYGDPTFFFIFDTWNVGLDNPRVTDDTTASYCVSSANSTGSPAVMSTGGSASLTQNDLELIATWLPANKNGIFYYGPNQIQVPFGNGTRCVGGTTKRLGVLSSGPSGILQQTFDASSNPLIVADTIWQFQAWFRDPAGGGAQYDLSDGLSVRFHP